MKTTSWISLTEENKKETGVYVLFCEGNKKGYVGSTSVSFKKRRNRHLTTLRENKHFNPYLQRSWNKYGESNFEFFILEICEPEKCIEREQFYIDLMKTVDKKYGYNQCPTAGSHLGRKHTEEAKTKIGAANAIALKGRHLSEECKAKLSKTLKGSHFSEETKERMRQEGKGIYGKNHSRGVEKRTGQHPSEETRLKLSIAATGRKHTEETKRKISQNHARPTLGTHRSEETKRKLSTAHMGKRLSEETKQKLSKTIKDSFLNGRKPSKPMLGKHPSEETRLKMSISHKIREKKKKEARREQLDLQELIF